MEWRVSFILFLSPCHVMYMSKAIFPEDVSGIWGPCCVESLFAESKIWAQCLSQTIFIAAEFLQGKQWGDVETYGQVLKTCSLGLLLFPHSVLYIFLKCKQENQSPFGQEKKFLWFLFPLRLTDGALFTWETQFHSHGITWHSESPYALRSLIIVPYFNWYFR